MHAMRIRAGLILLTAAVALAAPRPAGAQPPEWEGRMLVGASGGVQATSTDFADRFTIERHAETGTLDADYEVRRAASFDGSVAVRLWRRLGAGVAVSRFEDSIDVPLAARVPHPFFFDRHRSVEGIAGGLRRTETGIHLQAMFLLPVARHLNFVLSGGPSVFVVEQRLVSDIVYTEEYPYDVATFGGGAAQTVQEHAFGFNAGLDAIVPIARHLGVAGGLRFARAAVTLPSVGDPVDVDAGGLQLGAGLRVFF
jgi:hypothetical protein